MLTRRFLKRCRCMILWSKRGPYGEIIWTVYLYARGKRWFLGLVAGSCVAVLFWDVVSGSCCFGVLLWVALVVWLGTQNAKAG